MLQSDATKTIVKFLAVALAAYSGTLADTQPMYCAILSAFGVALQSLTVSGWTRADFAKTALKLGGQIAATLSGATQATHPQLAGLLLAVGAALPALTVPSPGTAAELAAAKAP